MTHSPEVADKLLDLIAQGRSLVSISKEEGMPSQSTVYRWLDEDEAFRERYARAREVQADALFDEVLTIADEATADEVQKARLRIDTRKWMAGKLRPKKYGDKLDIDAKHDVSDGLADLLASIAEKGARLTDGG